MGIIDDGFHVHYAAMPPVGKACRNFKLGNYIIQCRDGKCITEDGTLAGSTLDMATAVRNCVYEVGIPIEEL